MKKIVFGLVFSSVILVFSSVALGLSWQWNNVRSDILVATPSNWVIYPNLLDFENRSPMGKTLAPKIVDATLNSPGDVFIAEAFVPVEVVEAKNVSEFVRRYGMFSLHWADAPLDIETIKVSLGNLLGMIEESAGERGLEFGLLASGTIENKDKDTGVSIVYRVGDTYSFVAFYSANKKTVAFNGTTLNPEQLPYFKTMAESVLLR